MDYAYNAINQITAQNYRHLGNLGESFENSADSTHRLNPFILHNAVDSRQLDR